MYSERARAAVSALKALPDKQFVKYEWEELVSRLYRMDDPLLREMVKKEVDAIRARDPWFRMV